ncbi:hypothetical protein UUR5_0007, partial [Ureaplasma urealyticum serovar 5 str. ATCC 27817]
CLTSVFGMGTGISTLIWSLHNYDRCLKTKYYQLFSKN